MNDEWRMGVRCTSVSKTQRVNEHSIDILENVLLELQEIKYFSKFT